MSNNVTSIFDSIADAEFLQEPAYRWACFLIALSLFNFAWSGVLGFFKR